MRILVWSLTLFSDKMFSKRPANYCRNHTSRSFIEVACYCMLVHWLGLHHSLASHPEGLVAKAVPFGASFLSSFPSRPDISERSRTGNKPFLTQLVLLRWGNSAFHMAVSTPPHISPHCFPFTVEEPEVQKGSRAALLCSAEATSSLYNSTRLSQAHSLEAADGLEVSCNTHKCSRIIITSGLKSSTAHRAQPWNPLKKNTPLVWMAPGTFANHCH